MDSLIKRAKDDDTEALEDLWERTRKFAFAVSRRFRATVSVDADDLQQAAWLGFHAAVQKYTGKYSFLTLLEFCVRLECQQALNLRTQKQRRAVQTVSYDIPAPDGEQSMLDLFEDTSLSESDTAMIGADLARDVRAAVAELPERERMIIESRWLGKEVRPLHAVGRSMCISVERTRQLEERAFARLRDDPVLRSYIAAPPPNLYRTGLSRFTNNGSSTPEHAALCLIRADEKRQARKRTHAAYENLLASLRAEGYL